MRRVGELVAAAVACCFLIAGCGGSKQEVQIVEASLTDCPNGGFVITIDGEEHIVCNGEDGDSSNITVTELPEGHAECPAGGHQISVNGESYIVCHGEDGADGVSPPISIEVLPIGDEICPYGGVRITLDGISYEVCNGEDGAPGQDGLPGDDGTSPSVSVQNLPAGDPNCPYGGVAITVDGQTYTVCNGADGEDGDSTVPVVGVQTLPEGHVDCPTGGIEITIDDDSYVICHGEDGSDGTTPNVTVRILEEGDEDCPYGGYVINIDGDEYPVCHGLPGEAPVVSIEPIDPDDPNHDCPSGGYMITVGADVQYLCHGEDGAAGAGAVGIEALEPGEECVEGGYTIYLYDDEGAPISEYYVCHGEQGPEGPAPTVQIEPSEDCEFGGWTITIGDEPSFDLCNAEDGYSPSMTVDTIDGTDPRCEFGGYVITITSLDELGEEVIEEVVLCHAEEPIPEETVDWCKLIYPDYLVEIVEGASFDVYAQVHVEGVTGGCVVDDCTRPGELLGQAGFGPRDTYPDGNLDWTWSFDGAPNPLWDGAGSDVNDEWEATITIADAGDYDFAFRFSMNSGATWTYCDLQGTIHPYDLNHAGKVTVEAEAVGPTQDIVAGWTFGDEGAETWAATEGVAANASQELALVGATFTAWVAGYDGGRAPNSNTWNDGVGTKYWEVELSTLGFEALRLVSRQMSSNTGPQDFVVRWSLDGLSWHDLTTVTVANDWTSGAVEMDLPLDLVNQASVHIRWVMNSLETVREEEEAVGSAGTSRMGIIRVLGTTIE